MKLIDGMKVYIYYAKGECMTVKELIEALQLMPDDAKCLIGDGLFSLSKVTSIRKLNVVSELYIIIEKKS